MKTPIDFDPAKIQIHSIRFIESRIDPIESGKQIPYKIHTSVEEGLNFEQKIVRVVIHLNMAQDWPAGEPNTGKELGHFAIEFLFHVEDLTDWFNLNESTGQYESDGYLSGTLRGIAYSTSRGMLLNHLMLSPFSAVVLPVIDPMTIEVRVGEAVKLK